MFCLPQVHAQFYNGSRLTFGKNRVQYQHFNWQYYRTPRFDVYFYPTGEELARYTLHKAPELIDEIERKLNFSSTKKLQFIVYNTQSDFRESNFALDDDDFYNQGGVTNIYGTKVYLYFDGRHANLDKMIRGGIMNIYAHLLVEGASVRSNMASESMISVPAWYYSGLASFVGEDWNSDLDARVKDGILTGYYADLERLSPLDATRVGHSIWKFVNDQYGPQAITNILYATRSAKNYEKGFYHATGITFSQLILSWYRYYYVMYQKDMNRTMPEGIPLLTKSKRKREYANLTYSPDGQSFAYTTNEAGQIRVWLRTPTWKKPKCIFRRAFKTEDTPDLTFPLMAWHPSGKVLGINMEERGRCYYYPYLVDNRKWGTKILVDVEKITSWNYSNDGRQMIFSGFKNGQSDIFLFNFQARTIQNLTNDIYDDISPCFMPGQERVIFSSNRPHDTLPVKEHFYDARPMQGTDLFLYNLPASETSLFRLTRSPESLEKNILPVSNNQFIFLADDNGIYNRFLARVDSGISRVDTAVHYQYRSRVSPLTDNAYSLWEQALPLTEHENVGEIILKNGKKQLLQHPLVLQPAEKTFPAMSAMQNSRNNSRQRNDLARGKEKTVASRPRHRFVQMRQSDRIAPVPVTSPRTEISQDTISAVAQRKEPYPTKPLPVNADTTAKYTPPIPRNYYIQYSVNKLVTQADFSFLNTSYQQYTGNESPIYLNPGFNALVMVGLNDLFENYRITGGIRLSFDLSSSEFMASYEDLSRRVDHQIAIYRQSIKSSTDNGYILKQHNNSVFYIIKYPFNKFNSLRFTLKGRYETFIYSALDDRSLQANNDQKVWTGAKVEYVHDSSKELFVNLWKGYKVKVFAEYDQQVYPDMKNLLVFGVDARASFALYRNMTWATRFAASTNFGSGRLIYYMGGIDNWMLAKFNTELSVNTNIPYAYQTLATNMRGFEQNIRNGPAFALVNTELRIPFVQLLSRRHLGSNILNSLQLLIFADAGTAWSGKTPYSEENSLYSRTIESGPVLAEIRRQVEPIVMGLGTGLRASIFGYFIRLDYAWGIEDWQISDKKGMFAFSLGLDF
jgi:WD40 repeat protein